MNTFSANDIQQALKPLFDKYDFVRAFYQQTSGLSVSVNPRQSLAEPVDFIRGVVVTILKDGVLYEGSTSLTGKGDLEKLVEGMQNSLQRFSFSSGRLNLSEEEPLQKHYEGVTGEDYPLEKKINTATAVLKQIQELDENVVMAQVRYKHLITTEYYISSKKILSQSLSRFEAIFIAILKDPATGKTAQVYDGYGRQGGWELMTPEPSLLKKMLSDGKKILGAPRLSPGFYDCIFSPSMAGMLAHEAFGHGTEADTMVKKRARGSEYLGKPVASEKVSLYDSPGLEGAAASFFFDHEGQPQSITRIVEKGILNQPMTDHRSASILKINRSPNGRREAFDHKIYTRMTNTYFLPGEDTLDDMIASVKEGFFVDRATNGMEDPKSWGIQLEALYAERIKDRKLTGEVYSHVLVTGYVPDILHSISMVSEDFEVNGLGMCGKGYKEWVKVTDGGPYLRLRARLA